MKKEGLKNKKMFRFKLFIYIDDKLMLSRLKRDYIIYKYNSYFLLCNMVLGLCALFKVQNVLHYKVKFAIVTILQLQKKLKKSKKNTQNPTTFF